MGPIESQGGSESHLRCDNGNRSQNDEGAGKGAISQEGDPGSGAVGQVGASTGSKSCPHLAFKPKETQLWLLPSRIVKINGSVLFCTISSGVICLNSHRK